MPVWQLDKRIIFPDPELAEPDGLLAIGGDLSPERLILAYSSGIFPWFNFENEIFWFSPDPRCVLIPDELKISKSMKQLIRKQQFEMRLDEDFEGVIRNCAHIKRKDDAETWIDENFIEAYIAMHKKGFAHSAEAYYNGELCGGLYGLSLGGLFFGESMFSKVSNASKFALIHLTEWLQRKNFTMIDCQIYNDHLGSLGAKNISRNDFLLELNTGLQMETLRGKWEYLSALQ